MQAETLEPTTSEQSLADTDLRPILAHDFVTPNETVTVSLVCSHRRDVDDVVACDETEHEEGTGKESSSSRDRCRGGENDYPPTVVEGGGEPCHVLDHVLSLEGVVNLRKALERRERTFTRPES